MQGIEISCPYVDLAAQHVSLKRELMLAIEEVIDSGQFVLGPQVREFEQSFAAMVGVKEAVGLNSGTDALIFALKALGIGPGDEVITVPNSFVASTSCIEIVGATAVFVDIGEDYNIDPSQIENAITPRTKAILPVHLTGRPSDMDPILEIAERRKLYVIEDCAQAVQATYRERQVGSLGHVGCFSLHPLKTLNALGDGGVLTTQSTEVAERVRLYRNLGLQTRENCVEWCSNSRLDSIQAAALLVKLKYLDEWTEARRNNARLYSECLRGIQEIELPGERPFEKAVYHTYVILAENRNGLKSFLAEHGIGSAIHYPIPIHRQPVGRKYSAQSYPRTEVYAEKILSLPIHQQMTSEQIRYVSSTISKFYQKG